ncbi:MAG: methyltransferase domain-containing protein, partial [Acidobacteriota bacterium]
GNAETTQRALERVGALPKGARVIDLGCGPGASTVDLAQRLPDARVLGIDLHAPFVEELTESIRQHGLEARAHGTVGDMAAPPADAGPFDLMWSEGAAYAIGFERALSCWRPLLAPGGRIACSEAVWLSDERPPEVVANWEEYPEMTDRLGCLERAARAGLRLVSDFTLPESAWLEHYYDPMERTLEGLRTRYAGDDVALSVLEECQFEIDVYRRYSDVYGYQFFVFETA